MELRAAKERELLEDDPAISAMAPSSPPFLPTQPSNSVSISTNNRAAPKGRQSLPAQTNGMNGSASASVTPADTPAESASAARSSRHRDRRGRWSNAPSTNGSHEGTPVSTTGTEARASSARIRNRSTRAREAAEAASSRGRGSHANGASSARNGRRASSASANNGE